MCRFNHTLVISCVLGILLIKRTIEIEIAHFSLASVLFVASVQLLTFPPSYPVPSGSSFQLMVTACAFTQQMLLIIGVQHDCQPHRTTTTVLLLDAVLVVCGIYNAIKLRFERYAVPLLLFVTAVTLLD